MDDREILEGLVQGSLAAADALLERFGQPLIRYFAVHLPDPSQAEDMAQEVFLRLIRSLKRTQPGTASPEIRSLYSLLFTIARHLAIDVTKAAKRRPSFTPLDSEEERSAEGEFRGPLLLRLDSKSPDPRALAEAQQESEYLLQALRELPVELREVLVLRHIEGMSARDIAEVLRIAEGTVWSRLNRGMEELRVKFAEITTSPSDAPATAGRAKVTGKRIGK